MDIRWKESYLSPRDSFAMLLILAPVQCAVYNALDPPVIPHGSGGIKSPLRTGHDHRRPVYY